MKNIKKSPITTFFGFLILALTGALLFRVIAIHEYAAAVGALSGTGLTFAKDWNVSNYKEPKTPPNDENAQN